MSNITKLTYAIAFQLGWFICIMGGDIASVTYTITFLSLHLWRISKTERKTFLHANSIKQELLWISLVFICGLIIETVSFSTGSLYLTKNHPPLLDYPPFQDLIIPPLWLLNLWLLFAIALRTCLSFLLNNLIVTFILAVIFVPLNYYAGSNLNSTVHINKPYVISFSIITLQWLLFFTCLIKIKQRYYEETI